MLAERYGTVGELRGELEHGERARPRHTELRGLAARVTQTREQLDRETGTGLGAPWHVIVLNDNHNTFDGVAAALAAVLPDVSLRAGARLSRTASTRRAAQSSGRVTARSAEHYWNGLKRRGPDDGAARALRQRPSGGARRERRRFSVPCEQPADVRPVQDDDRDRRRDREGDHRPRRRRAGRAITGSATAVDIDASDA